MADCYGRECRLGWGFNDSLHRLIPVEGEPPNVTSQVTNEWGYRAYNLSSIIIPYWPWISLFLEPSCRKLSDFEIIFDDNEYWEVRCTFWRQRKSSEKLPKYPPNCSHFVSGIGYGVELSVQFPKIEFPEDDNEVEDLFEKRSFNEAQKKTKCRVLINYDEIREMTLEELVNFIDEIEKEEYSQNDIPVEFEYEELSQEIRETVISNEREFGYFLSYLYCVYRKIEMKMENTGYPDILQDTESEEKSFVKICSNLDKMKSDYKSMEKNNFLEMYPVLKRLFFCYTDYIKFSIEFVSKIDEGDHLPGTKEEMKPWLQKLNKWFPMKVNGEWINCTGLFIAIPPGYEQVVRTLHNTTKFRNCQVINLNEAVEPYVGDEENKNIIFGFVDMSEADRDHISDISTILELQCPKECTSNKRKWICSTCGDFVSIKLNLVGWQFLFCSCGSKRYRDNLLSCHHQNHQLGQQKEIQNQPEIVHPPVSKMEANQIQVDDNDNLLYRICEQLQKIKIREGRNTNPEILLVIIELQSKNKNKEETKDILRPLQDLTLDGDTEHLIRQYLDEDN